VLRGARASRWASIDLSQVHPPLGAGEPGETQATAAPGRPNRGLTCPVRWLHGDRSAASFRTAARRATRLIPNLTVVLVADVGHMLHHDQPDEVVNAVAALELATR